MTRRHRQFSTWVVYVALSAPLLTLGSCATIAQQSVITGFFDAVTATLVGQAQTDLGLTSGS